MIKVGSELFNAHEELFQPRRIDKESPGVTEMLFQTIQAAPIDTRADPYKYIVLSGGSTMYPGLPSRLEKEVKQLYLQNVLKGDSSDLDVSPFLLTCDGNHRLLSGIAFMACCCFPAYSSLAIFSWLPGVL